MLILSIWYWDTNSFRLTKTSSSSSNNSSHARITKRESLLLDQKTHKDYVPNQSKNEYWSSNLQSKTWTSCTCDNGQYHWWRVPVYHRLSNTERLGSLQFTAAMCILPSQISKPQHQALGHEENNVSSWDQKKSSCSESDSKQTWTKVRRIPRINHQAWQLCEEYSGCWWSPHLLWWKLFQRKKFSDVSMVKDRREHLCWRQDWKTTISISCCCSLRMP